MILVAIIGCFSVLPGCPNPVIQTELERCIFIDEKIDLTKWVLDTLDQEMAESHGYKTYQVASAVYDFTTADNRPLKTLVYYPAGKTDPSPTVLFSHGFTGSAESQLFIFKGLARRGNIVIAPDHVDAINYDRIGLFDEKLSGSDKSTDIVGSLNYLVKEVIRAQISGSLDFMEPLSTWTPEEIQALADSGELLQMFYQYFGYRVADMEFLFDRLPALNADDSLLRGRIDLDRIIVAGHSLGGATAIDMATKNSRLKALICLSPSSQPFTASDLGKLRTPTLYMTGDLDHLHDQTLKSFNANPMPKAFSCIRGGGHIIFSDRPFFYGLGVPFISNGQIGFTDNLPFGQGKADFITNSFNDYPEQLKDFHGKALTIVKTVCAFIDVYVNHDPRGFDLLSQTARDSFVAELIIK